LFAFRPLTDADFSLFREWRQRPHVTDVWPPDPDEVLREDYFTEAGRRGVEYFIILKEEQPFGFIQSYDCAQFPDWWSMMPVGTFGFDMFIAEENNLDRGLGSEVIRLFIEKLFLDNRVTQIICDPSPNNPRMIRACEKAGMTLAGEIVTPDGPAMLMKLERAKVQA
jgi:aminoglycoside 6'-N-acetyltransferase Ib